MELSQILLVLLVLLPQYSQVEHLLCEASVLKPAGSSAKIFSCLVLESAQDDI